MEITAKRIMTYQGFTDVSWWRRWLQIEYHREICQKEAKKIDMAIATAILKHERMSGHG